MDKMIWFGWLLKGHYEISLLDRLIGFGEFAALVIVGFTIWYVVTLAGRKPPYRRY